MPSIHTLFTGNALVATMLAVAGTSAAPLQAEDRSLERRDDPACPGQSTWTVLDDFMSQNRSNFISRKGDKLHRWTPDGLEMHINKDNNVSIIESKASWQPPFNLAFYASHTDFGGIVGSVALLRFDEKTEKIEGSEIDLELVSGQFQTPLWVKGEGAEEGTSHRLGLVDTATTKKEVGEEVLSGTFKDTTWTPLYAYKYPGYDPKRMLRYELEWRKDTVLWKIDGKERLRYSRIDNVNKFPEGPLPLRMGPWTAPQESTWAGILDWQRNPNPVFKLKDIKIKGCKA